MAATPDAGAAGGGDGSSSDGEPAASGDGAVTGDGAAMEVGESDAVVINTPDGGIMSMPAVCGGTCNGHSACRYPDKTKACGTPFCNTRKEVASFACDGNGGCQIALTECTDYACNDNTGACRTRCAAHPECLLPNYCASDNTCEPKKANAVACTTGEECASGNCSGNVCCNTACDGAGLTCTQSGHVGQCQCQGVTCATGVACQVFYRDSDGDGFGDASGTILAGTAKAGCAGMAPPTGFVADNTDCDDGDVNVNPKQTGFFATASAGKHTFDYDCSGAVEKETPEYPGATCKFCGPVGACNSTSTTCTTAGAQAAFQCPQESYLLRPLSEPMSSPDITPIEPLGGDGPISSRAAAAAGAAAAAPGGSIGIVPIPRYQCCGCYTNDRTAFLATIACGATNNTYTCGTCSAVGLGPSALTPTSKVQRCR
jgi:hypothetical protein